MVITAGFRFSVLFLVVLIVCFLSGSEANWFGKRGEKVDSALLQLLEENMPSLADSRPQMDAEDALKVIGRIIQNYFQQTAQVKAGTQ